MQLSSCLEKLSTLELLLVVLPVFILFFLMYENVKLLKKVKDLTSKSEKAKNRQPLKDVNDNNLDEYVLDMVSKGVEVEQISEQLNISVSRVELIVKFNKLRD